VSSHPCRGEVRRRLIKTGSGYEQNRFAISAIWAGQWPSYHTSLAWVTGQEKQLGSLRQYSADAVDHIMTGAFAVGYMVMIRYMICSTVLRPCIVDSVVHNQSSARHGTTAPSQLSPDPTSHMGHRAWHDQSQRANHACPRWPRHATPRPGLISVHALLCDTELGSERHARVR
jgi:hypothetical protein